MRKRFGPRTHFALAQHNAPRSFGTRVSLLTDDNPTVQLWDARQPLAVQGPIIVEPLPGQILCSRYVLEQVIGRGGTSVLFRARDLRPGALQRRAAPNANSHRVAIKLLHAEQRADPAALTRLSREFRQMQRLSHRGIARVFELDCEGELWFISMELVAGQTVDGWMRSCAADTDALPIITGCCEALEHAHSLGILHGDLKPTNVIVADDGTAKLIDFGATPNPGTGVAGAFDASVGTTPLYASPQILSGMSAERRDDVFSLACLSYAILSRGRHPFGGRPSFEDGRAKSAPTYVRTIPPAVFEVIERGLSAERERRPASAGEFLSQLTAAGQRGSTQPTGIAAPAADIRARSASPRLFRHIRQTARTLVPRAATESASLALDGFDAIGKPARYSHSSARLIVAVLAIVGVTEFLQLDARRETSAAAAIAPVAAAATPDAVSIVAPPTETVLQSDTSAHDSGVISFETPTVHASAGQSMVAISVKRLAASAGSAAFSWRVERGTAQPGIDYERVAPRMSRFIEGQVVRTLFIPLIMTGAPVAPRGPLTFTVALQQVAGGPALGRFARVTVAIDPPPALTLSRVAACCTSDRELSVNVAR
jgi:serine/threonine protein kinase